MLANTRVPLLVIDEVETICRNFLWARSEAEGGMHLVRWDEVCLSKSEGGLDLRKMRPWRTALMAKHAAVVLTHPEGID